MGQGFHRAILHYGFTEEIDIPRDLAPIAQRGIAVDPMKTSYFLGRQKLIAAKEVAGMALWRERLFASMHRNAAAAADFLHLPTNRIVELGTKVEI